MLYEIPILEHIEPKSLDDAVFWLNKYGQRAKIIAGGTDLLGLIKDNVTGPELPLPQLLINIKNIPGMKGIANSNGRLRIGAATTLAELEESSVIKEKYPIIAQASRSVATIQIRNVGTIGGNLCQRPWCSYFRNPMFTCLKKGGKQCYAVAGDHRYYYSILDSGTCVASHPSDLAPALVALGAILSVIGPRGVRTVPIDKFFGGPDDSSENVLQPNELLSEIQIPREYEGAGGIYLKDSIRDAWDLSLASAAVLLRMTNDVCSEARIVLGGLAPSPHRAEEAENVLQGSHIDEKLASEAAEKALERARGLRMTKYKLKIAHTIVKRAIITASQTGLRGK
jgi:xanthine dehydrogenase YagS FAD-binding subunit